MDIKLQELIKEFALENDRPKANKFKVTEADKKLWSCW